MQFAGLALGVCLIAGTTAFGGPQSTPTIEQSLSFTRASNPQISPDGEYVAYEVQEANWKENVFKSEIWTAATETGTRYQLTSSKKSSTHPRWSPDSNLIAFLSDRGGTKQIYVIGAHGGEARPLTEFDTDVADFRWSPDGGSIAFTAADPESKTQKDRKEKFGEFEIVETDFTMVHLWKIGVPTERASKPAKPVRFTGGKHFSVGSFSWSPDSKHIAFDATENPSVGSIGTSDIYVLNLVDKSVKKIVDTPGPDRNPVWSPDGTKIAYETADGREFFFFTNSYIAAVTPEGGQREILTKELDEKPTLIAWGSDGVYFRALHKTALHLSRLDPATKAIARVGEPLSASFATPSFTKDYRRMAFIQGGPATYPEVCVSTQSPFSPKPLSMLGEQVKPFRLATRELIEWSSKDGTRIEGVLLKPADYDPAKRYPLLVVIHGGPQGIDAPVLTPDQYYPLERFVAKGALVLRPNYRGSAGYGEKFRSLNVRNLGLGDYDDVISGVDHLIEQGMVDRDRVGAMGWSQGGYISAFITTYSDRFKAVSVGAGISDWATYYVNTDIHPFTRQYLKATPWDDPEIYRKTSPISYLKTAKTPTLIQHGENDKRVPIPNAYELYQALKDRGVPTKLVVFKGFGHGIDKPKQQRALMEQNYAWFSEWIWGEKPLQKDAKQSEIIARLEKRLPQLMKDGEVPGLAIALVRDGELAWHHGFGVKNSKTKEGVDDTTVFEAASLSKPVFAYAVLKLADSGKFDLDKPLKEYLPGNYDVGDDARLGQITARRVLSHTTGFPNWRGAGSLKIHFTPGERFNYSGEGFVYLAKVIEHVTGESFNGFMKRMVFDPLGMRSSSYIWQESYDQLKTFRHNVAGEPTSQNKPSPDKAKSANAAASLHTTAQDFGRFVAAMLNGTGLKPETRKLMLTAQVQVPESGTNSIQRPTAKSRSDVAWGLGWGLQVTSDGLSFWHWGDNGDSKAYVVAYDEPKLGVVVFANSANGLSIVREIVTDAVGGVQPALDWLNYDRLDSPRRALFNQIRAKGAAAAIREYQARRNGQPADAAVSESQINGLGYDLLGIKRVEDAIEVFKLNVSLYPKSWNTYDSLAEGYEAKGDKASAIKNFKRSLELNPKNSNAVEHLEKMNSR
jgi:dipeptidyl aminopeptidase/acylaminoacyl peptidase/CubicO group peptidase (beta-lactamase class C family)